MSSSEKFPQIDSRQPFSPAEFDAVCRELRRQCPYLSETSGARSAARNSSVGGNPRSKHVIGMARDFVAPSVAQLKESSIIARKLGMWVVVHDVGSGDHLHTQGLPPGEIPYWWRSKYS